MKEFLSVLWRLFPSIYSNEMLCEGRLSYEYEMIFCMLLWHFSPFFFLHRHVVCSAWAYSRPSNDLHVHDWIWDKTFPSCWPHLPINIHVGCNERAKWLELNKLIWIQSGSNKLERIIEQPKANSLLFFVLETKVDVENTFFLFLNFLFCLIFVFFSQRNFQEHNFLIYFTFLKAQTIASRNSYNRFQAST